MKKIQSLTATLFLYLLLINSCQKEQEPNTPTLTPTPTPAHSALTISQASAWYRAQLDTITSPISEDQLIWQSAKTTIIDQKDHLSIPISGRPTFQGVKQGYRRLLIQQDMQTKNISAKIIEVIPDAIYHQQHPRLKAEDFTGRVFEYDLNHRLTKGLIYAQGRPIGTARPASSDEIQAIKNGSLIPRQIGDQAYRPNSPDRATEYISGSCYWVTSTYIDAEGVFTVYAESYCNFYIDYNHNDHATTSIIIDGGGGGGGGGGTATDPYSQPTAPSNLPMEDQPSKDPKKLMDCFGTLGPNAAYQVKILVQEPMPGTSFNIGTNAFGHVAIQMSKTEGGSTITQTLGFYPTGTGLDKLSGPSRIVDNGGLQYNVSASYFIEAKHFQAMVDYVRNPPQNYHYTDFNCTAFVYYAAQKGNINLPNPTTGIGLAGPGNTATAMTPAGMASALKDYKTIHPNADVSNATGRATASKGECN